MQEHVTLLGPSRSPHRTGGLFPPPDLPLGPATVRDWGPASARAGMADVDRAALTQERKQAYDAIPEGTHRAV
jgi:hypothetical protein